MASTTPHRLIWLVLFCCSSILVRPDSSAVYILNEHLQLVTSTSLRWMEAENGERPLHAVVGGTNGTQSLFVCRAGDERTFPGQLSWDGCLSVVGGWKSQLFTNYQVLVNEEGSARLEWVDWKQFTALPQGAVNTAEDVYVAREEANAIWHNFIGGLHLHQQYGLIVVPPKGSRLTSGQVLVEHLPTKYELVAFKHERLRSTRNFDVLLDGSIEAATAGVPINFTYWDELYFGRGQNIATGSSVLLHMGNGTKVPLQWGIPQRLGRVARLRLADMRTAQVMATRVELQWDYFATLSAHYRDGAILMRPIKGVFRHITHENLRPVYQETTTSSRAAAAAAVTTETSQPTTSASQSRHNGLIYEAASTAARSIHFANGDAISFILVAVVPLLSDGISK